MEKRRYIIAGAILVNVILGLFLIMGCSDLPNKPESYGTFTIADFERILQRPAENYNLEEGNDAITIPADQGGVVPVVFSDGSTASLEIPPAALKGDTEITVDVTEIVLRDRAILQFDFQPDGLKFDIEATFVIDASAFRDADIRSVDWYYYHPDFDKWLLIDSYQVVDGKVHIKMPHFSKWMGISQGGQ